MLVRRRRLIALATIVAVAPLLAQGFGGRRRVFVEPNVPYDGRFTFVRLRYQEVRSAGWSYDYPAMERHFMKVVKEITTIGPVVDGSNIHNLDDPELHRFPIAYLSEPGYWVMTDAEAKGLREYLLKGGFLIVDDFMGREWNNFEAQMRRVLPDGRFVKLDQTHRIFDTFFKINDIDAIVHPMTRIRPSYLGIFEDNDPSKRLMVVANFDNDVPEYWEWSGQGLFPFDASNEAYKLGVNYMLYGLMH